MRADKFGHCWKWRDGSGYGVCPFCGLERKPAIRGGRRGVADVFRSIGSGGSWNQVSPWCKRLLRIGGTHRMGRRGRLSIAGLYLAWPARFICFDNDGRAVTIPVLAYWRARRSR